MQQERVELKLLNRYTSKAVSWVRIPPLRQQVFTSEKLCGFPPDHKFKVTLTVQARKVKADGNGNETPVPLNDYIEIGVFKGKKDEEQPLYLKKVKLTQEQNTFEIVVNEMPTRAGIDPYNKLIDRIADDNMIDVTKP